MEKNATKRSQEDEAWKQRMRERALEEDIRLENYVRRNDALFDTFRPYVEDGENLCALW